LETARTLGAAFLESGVPNMTPAPASPVTLVNFVTVKAGATQQAVLDSLRHNIDTVITTLKGWVQTTLVAGADGDRVVIYSQWDSADDIEAMRTDPRMLAYFPIIGELASFESMVGDAVLTHHR
jgi:quinol monooxygenase YgiN